MEVLAWLVVIVLLLVGAGWWFDHKRQREGRNRYSEGTERRGHLRADAREEMLQQIAERPPEAKKH